MAMKAVVIGESSGASREAIMAVYPRHKAVVDRFIARGVVVGIGPFADGGNMAIFKTRAEAEAFSKEDPFILDGLVKSFVMKDGRDSLWPDGCSSGAPPVRTGASVTPLAGLFYQTRDRHSQNDPLPPIRMTPAPNAMTRSS